MRTWQSLFFQKNDQLRLIDPLEMNLLVAKGIPSLAHLDVTAYQKLADKWAKDIARRLQEVEFEFHRTPWDWDHHLSLFRLGVLCGYVDRELGIHYREDQREARHVLYTDPSDLFLNGVMDSRRGTCGNMAALHVALGWRLGWPVSLACTGSHYVCRYDDGLIYHNVETTNHKNGGFHAHPDDYYLVEYRLSPTAVRCGSDLRAVSPREMLGLFIGLRSRHLNNIGREEESEVDSLLARALFPNNRNLYICQVRYSIQLSQDLFDPHEPGHPNELAEWMAYWTGAVAPVQRPPDPCGVQALARTTHIDISYAGGFTND